MSGPFNAAGNINYLKTKFNQNLAAGEKLGGHEFEMTIDQYPQLTILIRSTQLAAMGRSAMEDFGPMGLKFVQYGALENSQEIATTAAETISGNVLNVIREIVRNKVYIDINIRATPESMAGGSAASLKYRYEHCTLRSDVIEFSTEDQVAIVKPSMTITTGWIDV